MRHDERMGIGSTVARPRVSRESALDLASHLHGIVGNRRWNDCSIDYRSRGRLGHTWHRRILGQVSIWPRRDRADVSGGRGTRSAGIQAQMEGGRIDRTCQLLLSLFGLRGGGLLSARMAADAKLA